MVVLDVFEWHGRSFIPQFEGWSIEPRAFPIQEVLTYYQDMFEQVTFYADSWPRWRPNFGAGIIAGFLGARVRGDENTVWFETTADDSLENIRPRYDADN